MRKIRNILLFLTLVVATITIDIGGREVGVPTCEQGVSFTLDVPSDDVSKASYCKSFVIPSLYSRGGSEVRRSEESSSCSLIPTYMLSGYNTCLAQKKLTFNSYNLHRTAQHYPIITLIGSFRI